MNILEEIAGKTRERIEEEKRRCSPAEMKGLAEELLRSKKHGGAGALTGADNAAAGGCFYRALAVPGMSYICEVKKASPSKGLIAPDFPYLEIAKEYEVAGASAISCLTEPFYFRGADQYLKEITGSARIPVLRKDFTVDEYMIYQAKTLGASAVLLICAILDKVQLRDYRQQAESLGLDALVEAHDETEVEMALDVGAKIVGVNNRDLKTFQVDMQNSIRLRNLAPREVLFVSESGIKGPEEISILREHQVDAVLIGETLMRSTDKKAELERLNGSPLKR
ncbi:indole-3-glycerol phosphate synthase TrpC [Laedolimicola sp.]|uniref:indole-3-glycerol phosphate synthase TrpC n=1 Tax=Laedolimicola sp. TaxID=2981663 RepID=UPI003F80120F